MNEPSNGGNRSTYHQEAESCSTKCDRGKIGAGFGALLLIVLFLGALAIVNMRTIHGVLTDLTQESLPMKKSPTTWNVIRF